MKQRIFTLLFLISFHAILLHAETVLLESGKEQIQLGQHLEYLEDPEGRLLLEEVRSPSFSDQWIRNQKETPGFGYTDSAYWFRTEISVPPAFSDEWLLEISVVVD